MWWCTWCSNFFLFSKKRLRIRGLRILNYTTLINFFHFFAFIFFIWKLFLKNAANSNIGLNMFWQKTEKTKCLKRFVFSLFFVVFFFFFVDGILQHIRKYILWILFLFQYLHANGCISISSNIYIYIYMCVCVCVCVCSICGIWFPWFNGISTFIGYLMQKYHSRRAALLFFNP